MWNISNIMIRIDEIYNNIIWAWIKNNKNNSRLFYCDPPGTSNPSNLFNQGSNYVTETDYFFLHDQEPIHIDIHQPLFDDVIRRNDDINPTPQGNVIVSEINSEFLESLTERYKWRSHYYFYHGWAALDWYRGYHRSFLIPRAKNRTPTKAFISPNRIIGGKRDHRVLFLYHVFKHKLDKDNNISAPLICPEENININSIALTYKDHYPDILDIFNKSNLPYLFADEHTQLMTSSRLSNFNESADSLFYVVTETVFFGRRSHLTEKTFKPIVLEMPFILVAPQGSLEYLRSYGFKTFDGIIDESYDNEPNDIKRIEMVAKLLNDINSMSLAEKQQLHKRCLRIVEYNYNHFYHGDFEGILWSELLLMLNGLND